MIGPFHSINSVRLATDSTADVFIVPLGQGDLTGWGTLVSDSAREQVVASNSGCGYGMVCSDVTTCSEVAGCRLQVVDSVSRKVGDKEINYSDFILGTRSR